MQKGSFTIKCRKTVCEINGLRKNMRITWWRPSYIIPMSPQKLTKTFQDTNSLEVSFLPVFSTRKTAGDVVSNYSPSFIHSFCTGTHIPLYILYIYLIVFFFHNFFFCLFLLAIFFNFVKVWGSFFLALNLIWFGFVFCFFFSSLRIFLKKKM